jgi:hypothetical protein
MSGQITFSFQYIISLCLATFSSYWIYSIRPQAHPAVTFLMVPLFAAYMSLLVMNSVLPSSGGGAGFGSNLQLFVEDQVYSQINNWEYMQILPPLFAILIIFIVVVAKFV